MKSTEPLKSELESFINSPFPLWEASLTSMLCQVKYKELISSGIADRDSYSTAAAFNTDKAVPHKESVGHYDGGAICLEIPDFENLSCFYDEHGLLPLSELELVQKEAATKVKAALDLLSLVPECITCISKLVNCIQVIAAEGPDYDTSYSHPKIPFTIFVSVCDDDSPLSSLRVAESILHEAMHLKLTLIESAKPLVKVDTGNLFYSPWRDEERPAQGVLHGLFVFLAILDLFSEMDNISGFEKPMSYLNCRKEQISSEIGQLEAFALCLDLTEDGANLVTNLLP